VQNLGLFGQKNCQSLKRLIMEMLSPFSNALRSLPLFDDLYLKMQAQNLGIVDGFLRDIESETDAENTSNLVFLSAFSQLWIFGLYELLRTWRQRVLAVVRFGEEIAGLSGNARQECIESMKEKLVGQTSFSGYSTEKVYTDLFSPVENDSGGINELDESFARVQRVYGELEALRMTLAKHEIPKKKNVLASMPGYARWDHVDRSLLWIFTVEDKEQMSISRRDISDRVCRLLEDPLPITVPRHLRAKLQSFPKSSYGVHRVTFVTEQGSEFIGFVRWGMEIVNVENYGNVPFSPDDLIDICEPPSSQQ